MPTSNFKPETTFESPNRLCQAKKMEYNRSGDSKIPSEAGESSPADSPLSWKILPAESRGGPLPNPVSENSRTASGTISGTASASSSGLTPSFFRALSLSLSPSPSLSLFLSLGRSLSLFLSLARSPSLPPSL